MPHIQVIFPETESEVVRILSDNNNKRYIRKALSKEFPMYPVKDIAIIPKVIPEWQMKFADNLLPLEFVIDVGKQKQLLSNINSDDLCRRLTSFCPDLEDINFGVWLREMPSNGFTEHKTEE